jgi:hypothetical protein
MARSYKRVYPAEVLHLRLQREAGATIAEIAKQCGRSLSVTSRICTGSVHKTDPGPLAPTSRHRINETEAAEILQLMNVSRWYLGKPVSDRAIASQYGVTRATAARFMAKAQRWISNFNSKVDRSPGPEKCWPWRGGTLHRNGKVFGRFVVVTYHRAGRPKTQAYRAHKLSYELQYGRVKVPLVHSGPVTCDGPCVSPLCWRPRSEGNCV